MKIGVLGTGMVGRTLGTRLAALGNEVMMGGTPAQWLPATGTRRPGRVCRPAPTAGGEGSVDGIVDPACMHRCSRPRGGLHW